MIPQSLKSNKLIILTGLITGFSMFAAHQGRLPSTPSEVFGTVIGLMSMVLAIRQNILNFPTGMIYNICYMVIFFYAHLYGMMGLQVIFFILQAHGWYNWKYGIHQVPARISHVPFREALILVLLGIPTTLLLSRYLGHVGGVMTLADAFTTIFSLIAQYMLNLKRIENWALGVVLDVVFIIVYVSQGLYITAGSFVIYLILCVLGYRQWHRELRAQRDRLKAPMAEPIEVVSPDC